MGTKSGVLLALGVLGLVGAAMLLVRRHGRYEPKADLLGPSVNNMLRRVGGGGMRCGAPGAPLPPPPSLSPFPFSPSMM